MESLETEVPDSRIQERQLIAAAREGCRHSLEKLIADSRNYLLAISAQELPADVRGKVAPSDLVQDSLLEAHRDFGHFTGTERPELLAWLRQILIHNVLNAKRKYRKTSKRELAREFSIDAVDGSGRSLQLPDQQKSPSSITVSHEQEERLQRAIARLPADYQQVILLRHREHLPFNEIAERLNRTSASTRKIWSRAIERLQRELRADDEHV